MEHDKFSINKESDLEGETEEVTNNYLTNLEHRYELYAEDEPIDTTLLHKLQNEKGFLETCASLKKGIDQLFTTVLECMAKVGC